VIGISEISVALVASLVVAIVVVLGAALLIRIARFAFRSCRGADLWSVFGDEHDHDPGVRWGRRRTAGIVGCLVVAAVAGLLGTFVPLYRDFPHRGRSISLYNTMHYGAIVAYLDLALLVVLAYLALRRRDRLIAALIVGYCATEITSFAVFATGFTTAHTHLGPGYYLLGIGDAAEVAALVLALGIVVTGRAHHRHPSARIVPLGGAAAVLVGASAAMSPWRPAGAPLWIFSSVPRQTAAALLVGLVALAVIPLLAVRLADRASAFMVLGLAAAEVLVAAGAVLDRLDLPRFTELTPGFWLTALAAIVLVWLAFALAASAHPPVRASEPLDPGDFGPVGIVGA
jgi:hypothetical protein